MNTDTRRTSRKRVHSLPGVIGVLCVGLSLATALSPVASVTASAGPYMSEICAGRVREFPEARVEVRVLGRTIEVRVFGSTGDLVRATGSVSTVLERQPLRLALAEREAGVLQATAPSAPPLGASAIVHLRLSDGAKLQARFPLVEVSDCQP